MPALTSDSSAAPKPYGPAPSSRQLDWHELELYAFLHFGLNTFTNREWGTGEEKPVVFQPTEFDADQIVSAIKAGGLRGLILTAKHHDGFCLWPTKYSEHSVRHSPWKEGKGDMVREFADACKRHGLKFGIYISPWDRNHPDYGRPAYVEYYKNTIKELLTNYGSIFEMWFDGANGGDGWYGGNPGRRLVDYNTYYDWKGIRKIIHELQPGCAIWCAQYSEDNRVIWADCRWGGSETGRVGDPCWNTMDSSKPVGRLSEHVASGDRHGDIWCPAEGNVSIRPGWFYHAEEDHRVRPPSNLMDIYFQSVGRGANFILNIPPDRRGLVHENDVKALAGFGELLEQTFSVDLAQAGSASASGFRAGDSRFAPGNLVDGRRDTYWTTNDSEVTPEAVLQFTEPVTFNIVRLREFLPLGQRVDDWALDVWDKGEWREFAKGTAVGNCRLVKLNRALTTTQVRLRITKAAVCPAISELALFLEPPRLSLPKMKRSKDAIISFSPPSSGEEILYTLDGSEPSWSSAVYSAPIPLPKGGTIKARSALRQQKRLGEVAVESYDMSKSKWKIHFAGGSARVDGAASHAIDDSPLAWEAGSLPQEIAIDMGEVVGVKSFSYLPRQDKKTSGMVDKYKLYLSMDGEEWGDPVAQGEFGNLRHNPIKQTIPLSILQQARFFKFVGTHCLDDGPMTVAEFGVICE